MEDIEHPDGPFSVQLPEAGGLQDLVLSFRITSDLGESSSPCLSTPFWFASLKRAHKESFLPHIRRMHETSEEPSNPLSHLLYKCKQRLQVSRFPLLPHQPLRHHTDSIVRETFRRSVEDYLNLIYYDYGFLLQEEACSLLGLPESMHLSIIESAMQYNYTHFFSDAHSTQDSSTLGGRRDHTIFPEDPNDPLDNIGWLMRAEKAKRGDSPVYDDRTEEFESYLDDPQAIPEEWKTQFVFVFVPGLYSGLYKSLAGYFIDNIKPLQDCGVSVCIMEEMSSFSSVLKNCVAMEHFIRDLLAQPIHTGKQAILIGHSKGGVDSISALAFRQNKLLEDRLVGGLVMIQSPYAGSPFAFKIGAFPAMLRGVKAMNDLNYTERRNFLEMHPFHVKDAGIPVLCFVTEVEHPKGALRYNMKKLQKKYGVNCDGLVVPEDAIVPDSMVIRLKEVDHADTVFRHLTSNKASSRYHPSALTIASIRVLLSKKD